MNGILYWPNAVTEDDQKLFTSDGMATFEEAVNQLEILENSFKHRIAKAWIGTSDGKRYGMSKKWVVRAVSIDSPKVTKCRWKVVTIRSGRGATWKLFHDYDEALKYAATAKEDCESVSVYERENDGWKKAFNV